MMYEDKIDEVNKRLSDIQRATVDYLDRRMFEEGQNRMLVADDVGLGKTWVAKGVIARAYKRWLDSKPCKGSVILERSEGTLKSLELSCEKSYFNIYYICSNQQLAAQNQGLTNIEITDKNIKDFDRVARKYGVDYAVKKDKTLQPPHYLVFFKAKDTDALTAAFREYTANTVKKKDRNESVVTKLQEILKNIKDLPNKKKHKELEL